MSDLATSIIAGTDSEQPDVAAATAAAAEAFAAYRATTPEERSAFLEAVAAEIEADKDAIIPEAVRESGLPEGRITGEVGRTTGQLRMFAGVVRQGDHLGVRIDPALPDRAPLPRADIRQRMVPLGPVAVFGASNFPLAFSTAGGDTASALAAGCPVVVLPGALEGDVAALAQAYVGSLTLGSGQFCTNPGLLFLPSGERGDAFLRAAGEAVSGTTGQQMLTPGIADAYASGTASLRGTDGIRVVGEGAAAGEHAPAPVVYEAPAELLAIDDSTVTDEVFGAAGVVVRYDDVAALLPRLEALEGQLTATVHATDSDVEDASALLPVLELRAGRVLFNGWPTGVEVGHAMVHGGPYPATSDSRSTSVGSLAIERFQRPVAYQDVPAALLPAALRDDNPWGLRRRLDGELE
jgi:acyl-CoA reductase-like NAD-dependent aldehyde dehydrogenase